MITCMLSVLNSKHESFINDVAYRSLFTSYPADNCAAIYPGLGDPVDPQTEFPNYLTHYSGINIVKNVLNSTMIAQQVGKPFIMFETNSASCGGFAGISTSFGAALWTIDYTLQAATLGIEELFFHEGVGFKYNFVSTLTQSSSSSAHMPTFTPFRTVPARHA